MVRVPIDAVLHVGHDGAVGFAGEITVGELDHRRADVCRLPCFVSLTRGPARQSLSRRGSQAWAALCRGPSDPFGPAQ